MDIRFNKFNKIIYKLLWVGVRLSKLVSQDLYLKLYQRLLSKFGMKIADRMGYIDPSAFFDNYDYSFITIGSNVTISREVLFLTHDFSISQGLAASGKECGGYFMGKITIEDNRFIGARVTVLPNTHIGKNCIIGAGTVVKGKIEENSIMLGNPARCIGHTDEWGNRHFQMKDYIPIQ